MSLPWMFCVGTRMYTRRAHADMVSSACRAPHWSGGHRRYERTPTRLHALRTHRRAARSQWDGGAGRCGGASARKQAVRLASTLMCKADASAQIWRGGGAHRLLGSVHGVGSRHEEWHRWTASHLDVGICGRGGAAKVLRLARSSTQLPQLPHMNVHAPH